MYIYIYWSIHVYIYMNIYIYIVFVILETPVTYSKWRSIKKICFIKTYHYSYRWNFGNEHGQVPGQSEEMKPESNGFGFDLGTTGLQVWKKCQRLSMSKYSIWLSYRSWTGRNVPSPGTTCFLDRSHLLVLGLGRTLQEATESGYLGFGYVHLNIGTIDEHQNGFLGSTYKIEKYSHDKKNTHI